MSRRNTFVGGTCAPSSALLVWFGSAVNLERLQTDPVGLTITGVNVKAVDCIRDLGVHLDSRLDLRVGYTSVASYRHATSTYDSCGI